MSALKLEGLKLPEGFTITSHAGAMSLPDNSLIALCEAIKVGADIVEMDVSIHPDGTPVIIHSETPKQNEGVLLDEAFAVVAESDNVKINLDLKTFKNISPVQDLAVKHGLLKRVFFTGVEESSIEIVKTQCSLIPYFLNASTDSALKNNVEYAQELSDRLIQLGCVGLNCSFGGISKTLVDVLHKNSLLISVWTVNRKADMRRMLSISVDNITTRKPVKLKLMIESINQQR
ncbi:MAG: glycerophosphodiester phosphodiesterase [Eubacteriales bacterium]